METHKFKVGDLVEVVNNGNCYQTFRTMFKKHGFINKKENPGFDNGTTAKVFAVDIHEDDGSKIYAIVDENGNESLISEVGLKLSEKFSRKITINIDFDNDMYLSVGRDGIRTGGHIISADKLKEIISAAKQVGLID